MDWRKITMPPSTSDIPEPVGLTMPINNIYKEHDKPKDFCVFLAVNQSHRALYFSPVATRLCREFIGQLSDHYEVSDCDAPVNEPLDLYVGDFKHDGCLRLLN